MNLEFTPEEQAFRDEVRAFIAENYPKHLGDVGLREDLSREDFLAWHKILGEKGWSVPAWPVEYGGTGWTPTQRYIWSEENARVNAVMPLPFGVSMVGPVIYTFGNEAQKKRALVLRSPEGETFILYTFYNILASALLRLLEECREVGYGDAVERWDDLGRVVGGERVCWMRGGNGENLAACVTSGANADVGVFDHDAVARRSVRGSGGFEEDFWVGFSVLHIAAGDDVGEVITQTGGPHHGVDIRARCGCCQDRWYPKGV